MKVRYVLYSLFLILFATILLNKLTIKRQDQDRNISKKPVSYKKLPAQQEKITSKKLIKNPNRSKLVVSKKEIKEKIDSILSKLRYQIETDVYAEEFIPLIIELEDLLIDDGSHEQAMRHLFNILEQEWQPVSVKAICIFALAVKPSDFAMSRFIDMLYKEQNERLQMALIVVVAKGLNRYDLPVQKRVDFWKGAFFSGYNVIFCLNYPWQFLYKVYGNAIPDPGWQAQIIETETPDEGTFWTLLTSHRIYNFKTDPRVKEVLTWYLFNGKSTKNKSELLNRIPRFDPEVDGIYARLFKDKTAPKHLRMRALSSIAYGSADDRWNTFKALADHADDLEMRRDVLEKMVGVTRRAEKEKETFELLDRELKNFYYAETFAQHEESEDIYDAARYVRGMIHLISRIETTDSYNYIFNLYRTTPFNYVKQAIVGNITGFSSRDHQKIMKEEVEFLQWLITNEPDSFLRFKAAGNLYQVIKRGINLSVDRGALIREYEYLRDAYKNSKDLSWVEEDFNDAINLIRNQ